MSVESPPFFRSKWDFDNSIEAIGSTTALRLKERTLTIYKLLIEGNPQCVIARKTGISRQVVHYHTKILEGKRFIKAHDRRDKILIYKRGRRASEIEEYMARCEIVKKCAKSALPMTSRKSNPSLTVISWRVHCTGSIVFPIERIGSMPSIETPAGSLPLFSELYLDRKGVPTQ